MTYDFEISRSFRAMNADVRAVVCTRPAGLLEATHALDRVKAFFGQAEGVLSRFLPGSELSLLNASGDHSFRASPMLFEVVSESLRVAETTDGIFDPTVLACLIAAGYDSSFEKVCGSSHSRERIPARHTWRDVALDSEHMTITMPDGCSLDLGGIAKGWAVDRASEMLCDFPGFALDAGGDMVLRGTQSNGSAWTVGVANPFFGEEDLTQIEATAGAVCTSSTLRRRWCAGGRMQHHIIDPRTGRSANSGVVAATVTADCAVQAEVIAKVSIIVGPTPGLAFIRRQPDVEGMLVLENSQILRSSGFKEMASVA
jgi:thiamine biosynthesis lipoprotein